MRNNPAHRNPLNDFAQIVKFLGAAVAVQKPVHVGFFDQFEQRFPRLYSSMRGTLVCWLRSAKTQIRPSGLFSPANFPRTPSSGRKCLGEAGTHRFTASSRSARQNKLCASGSSALYRWNAFHIGRANVEKSVFDELS